MVQGKHSSKPPSIDIASLRGGRRELAGTVAKRTTSQDLGSLWSVARPTPLADPC